MGRAAVSSTASRLCAIAIALTTFAALFVGCASAGRVEPSEERIIVSGASGQLGGLVVEELLARGVPANNLILVSRTPETLAEYAAMGASIRYGDFNEPASLEAAYAGGTRMLLISINTLERRPELHGNAIDAAVRAGVRHIAYTSFVDATNNPSPIATDHRATEARLRSSGVAWTMLRNQLYMDGLVAQAVRMVSAGQVTVRLNETQTAYVTRRDCAAAAAAVLSTPGHENRIYEITGPAPIGPNEIASAASEITGRLIMRVVESQPTTAPGPANAPNASATVVSGAVADLTGRPAMGIDDLLRENRDALIAALPR